MTDKPSSARQPRPASARQGAADTPTQASAWKTKSVGGTLITVPSGNRALVRAPGIQTFLQHGVIPNTLMPIIQEAMSRGGAPTEEDLNQIAADPERIRELMELTDAVTIYCCIEPAVVPMPYDEGGKLVPIGDPRRDPDLLYVDELDMMDKMFIFNFAVGGPADLANFRQEQE